MRHTLSHENIRRRSLWTAPSVYQVFTERQFDQIAPLRQLEPDQRFAMRVVANVLPFRANNYVIDELIDWDSVPEDPIFQLTFPQPGMLDAAQFERMATLLKSTNDRESIRNLAREIRRELNPHPAGQMALNVPELDGKRIEGLQHKYRETVLFFPSQGQTCHSYCTFCFRWAQFIGEKELRFGANEAAMLHEYVRRHPRVSDVLFTGGDPLIMKTATLRAYLEPLLAPDFAHITTIRLGTKSLSFWPQRYVTDEDSDALLRLFDRLVRSGKQIAIMAHFNHWRELDTPVAREAIRRVLDTGAVIRSQSPIIAHINDSASTWARMWRMQARLGIQPYYMFVARDTGAKHYFELPLGAAWETYREAIKQVSGIARTARGPSMSAGPGKIEVQGVAEVRGEKVFVLRFIQGRNPDWVQRPFFARYDSEATWLDQLKPAFGETEFFFEKEYAALCRAARVPAAGNHMPSAEYGEHPGEPAA